jgi:hypothetical protein
MNRKPFALLAALLFAASLVCGAIAEECQHTETFWDVLEPATCTEAGMQQKRCSTCGREAGSPCVIPALGHQPGDPVTEGGDCVHDVTVSRFCTRCGALLEHTTTPNSRHDVSDWMVIREPTRDREGHRVKICLRCGEGLATESIPMLGLKYGSTACSQGPRFRDERPGLTDEWNMYTPLDLSREGSITIPLVASNQYVIGSVRLSSQGGNVTVRYELDIAGVNVRSEFLAFFSDLESVVTIEPSELTGLGFPLGKPFSIRQGLLGDTSVLMYLALLIDYDSQAPGIMPYTHGKDLDRPLVPSGPVGPTLHPAIEPPEPRETQAAGYRTLSLGNEDPAVQRLKNRLYELGYTQVHQQGNRFTAATALAVKSFQTVNDLTVDGVATPETQALLFSQGARRKP